MSCCDIFEKFGGAANEVFSNDHWVAQARPKQPTLGSCVLIARRHAESLAGLSPDEARAFAEAVTALESRLRSAFKYDKINYLLLMMVDRHLHFHVIPRYSGPRSFAGIEWADPAWPKGPPQMDSTVGAEAAVKAVVEALRRA